MSTKPMATTNQSRKRGRHEGDRCKPRGRGRSRTVKPIPYPPHRVTKNAENIRLASQTERLLQLVENGTLEHAQLAARQLSIVTAPEQSSSPGSPTNPLVLWEIIGRLTQFLLVDSNNGTQKEKQRSWQIRYNASLAIDGVAQHLPLDDQINFLHRISAAQSQQEHGHPLKSICSGGDEKTTTGYKLKENETLWLKVVDLTDETLESILVHGRKLLARGRLEDDMNCGRDRQHLMMIQETDFRHYQSFHNADFNLTRNFAVGGYFKQQLEDRPTEANPDLFLHQRITLQRQLLAQKLGLSSQVLRDVTTSTHDPPSDILCKSTSNQYNNPPLQSIGDDSVYFGVANRDLLYPCSHQEDQSEAPGTAILSASVQKRKEHVAQVLSESRAIEDTPRNSMKAEVSFSSLLVLEMKQQQRKFELQMKQTHANSQTRPTTTSVVTTKNTSVVSHANPQSLLATELLYRMFDPSWEVRHGALLGVSALLRSWWKNINRNDRAGNSINPLQFGRWLEDIMGRCLCCLILDRFEDYSGATPSFSLSTSTAATEIGCNESNDDDAYVGGVTAPVREMAGQVLSAVYMLAPRCKQQRVLAILCDSLLMKRLFRDGSFAVGSRQETKSDFSLPLAGESYFPWEVRHGALLALKYIVGLIRHSRCNVGHNQRDWHAETLLKVVRVTCQCLTDVSDDVKSAAAQVLTHVLALHNKLPSSAKICQEHLDARKSLDTAAIPIWYALRQVGIEMSSCIVDLVALFSALLGRGCGSVIRTLNDHESLCFTLPPFDLPKSLNTHHDISFSVRRAHASDSFDSTSLIPNILNKMIDIAKSCEYPSVRQSMLRAIGTISGPAVSACLKVDTDPNVISGYPRDSFQGVHAMTGLSRLCVKHRALVQALCRAIQFVYDSWFFCHVDSEKEVVLKEVPLPSLAVNQSISCSANATRNRTWAQLSQAAAVIFSAADSVSESMYALPLSVLLGQLVRRYFGIGSLNDASLQRNDKDSTTRDSLSLKGSKLQRHLDLARILAEFVFVASPGAASSSHTLNVLDFAFGAFLESPICWQCQAACLLYIEIRSCADQLDCNSSRENARPIEAVLDSYQSRIHMALQKPPFMTSKIEVLRSFDAALDKAFETVVRKGMNGKVAADAVLRLFHQSLRQEYVVDDQDRSHDIASLEVLMMTPSLMRLKVAISAATVADSASKWPTKLTPLVRSLMTSLKNENDETCQNLTASTASEMIQKLALDDSYLFVRGEVPCDMTKHVCNRSSKKIPYEMTLSFQRTRSKVLESLCDIVAAEKDPSHSTGRKVVASLVRRYCGSLLTDLVPIWNRLSKISDGALDAIKSCCAGELETELVAALTILHAVCGAVTCGSAANDRIISDFLEPLVFLCHVPSSGVIRDKSLDVLLLLCRIDSRFVVEMTLPLVVKFMNEQACDQHRLRACCLLCRLVNSITTDDTCCFVRTLMPVVMSIMADSNEECAKMAAYVFSCLVRAAPLVPKEPRKESSRSSIDVVISGPHDVIDTLIHGDPLPPCVIPQSIDAALSRSGTILRKYQMEGLSWLRFLQSVRLNGALCDSMGLGKTLQALLGIALAYSSDKQPSSGQTALDSKISLVVCPSTLVGHWMNEVDRYFPNQSIFCALALTGNASQRKLAWDNRRACCNLVVASYASVRNDVEYLESTMWRYCVLDEGHLLKNPKTGTIIHRDYTSGYVNLRRQTRLMSLTVRLFIVTARALRRIRSRHRLILTGTPIQNNVNELWATFDFLMPNFLGSFASFSKEFARPITRSQHAGATAEEIYSGMEQLKLLHQQVLPFILRREKDHVLQELPPKTITTIPCEMSPFQLQIYRDFCSDSQSKKSLETFQEALHTKSDYGRSRIESDTLKSLLFLRLLCTHPSLALASRRASINGRVECCPNRSKVDDSNVYSVKHSGKLLALSQLLTICGFDSAGIIGADNDSSLLYCGDDRGDEIDEVSTALNSVDWKISEQSNECYPSKCLIFAQFASSLDLVEDIVLKKQFPTVKYLRLDGRVSQDRRSNLIESFNRDEDIRMMLLTTRVGGLGLSLAGKKKVSGSLQSLIGLSSP